MNLSSFLKKIDRLIDSCDKEKLAAFIHDTARLIKESEREDFIARLSKISDEKNNGNEIEDYYITDKYESVSDYLEEVETGERVLYERLNEDYDDWYDSSDDEFYYEDEEGICDVLTEAIEFVHKCVDLECYEEGFEIGRRLFLLDIQVESEYDSDDLVLSDLERKGLLNINMKQILLDTLYCAYFTLPMDERPDIIYEIISDSSIKDIKIEDLMQYGDDELKDFEVFLDLWIKYLGTSEGSIAEKLFKEAVDLKDDANIIVDIAKEFVTVHPAMYLQIFEQNQEFDNSKMFEIGIEALDLIDVKYLVRSKIALETAKYALKLEKYSEAESCYLECFRSDTTPINYLRVLLNCRETLEYKNKMRDIYKSVKVSSYIYGYVQSGISELSKNNPDKNTIYVLEFLDGQFMRVLKNGMNEKAVVGWTGTFMKMGLSLFLAYLYNGEEAGKGVMHMIYQAEQFLKFTAESYVKGLAGNCKKDDFSLFYECFRKWKNLTPVDEDDKKTIIETLETIIEMRVDGIMNANRTNYYNECAAFIAAMGEVKESLGEENGKQCYMQSYRNKYPRRTSFKKSLEMYGWRNPK